LKCFLSNLTTWIQSFVEVAGNIPRELFETEQDETDKTRLSEDASSDGHMVAMLVHGEANNLLSETS
jgi:hypothetical protein